MHIQIMRIKASTEVAFERLRTNPSMASARDPATATRVFMERQIDAWMEEGYRKPRTVSDVLDNRHHKLARRTKL